MRQVEVHLVSNRQLIITSAVGYHSNMNLGAVVLLCAIALTLGQSRNVDEFAFPGETNDNQRPGRPTTVDPSVDTTVNPGVDGAGALIGCNCPTTPEFNVVCGTDGNTYGNLGKLKCAQRCGQKVELAFRGNCRTRT